MFIKACPQLLVRRLLKLAESFNLHEIYAINGDLLFGKKDQVIRKLPRFLLNDAETYWFGRVNL